MKQAMAGVGSPCPNGHPNYFSMMFRCGSRGGGLGARGPPLTPYFEAQLFAATATPLRDVGDVGDVGKISAAPPYTNPGSAPDVHTSSKC